MKSIIDSISNRELAFLVWFGVFVVFLLFSASLRRSTASILSNIFWSKLTVFFAAVAGYTVGVAYMLRQWNMWDSSQLKNTVLWFFTVGAASLFDITNKKKGNYFRAAVKDVLGITALLQFIVGIYSFNFLIELFAVPLAFLVGGLLVVTQHDKQHYAIAKLITNLVALAGVFSFCYTIYRIVSDPRSFANEGTLKDFLIPALFSLLFLPLLYVLSIIVTHEDLFTGIVRKIKNPAVRRYARWKVLINFHANKADLHRWQKIVFLQRIETKEDVKKSIELIKEMKLKEKNAPLVNYEKGWSPYAAKDFLQKEGIVTGFYQPVYEDEWMACSEYVRLDNEILANTIAYYVEGDATAALKLKLTLNVHNKEHSNIALIKFFDAAKFLCRNALQHQTGPEVIEKAIIQGENWDTIIGNRRITVEKKKWEGHKAGGHHLTLMIEVI